MLKNKKKSAFCLLDASLCEQISSASKSLVVTTISRCTLILCLISFFTINLMTKMWSDEMKKFRWFLLPKNGDMRWWVVFDHGQKFCKNNFVLDTILRSGLDSDSFLTSFNLSKKDLKFWPTNQIVRLHYLNLNFTCMFLNAEEVKKRWLS